MEKKKHFGDIWHDLAGFCVGINDLYLSSQKCHVLGAVGGGFFPLPPSLLDWSEPLCCGKISRPYIYLSALNRRSGGGRSCSLKKRSGGGIVT